MSYLGKALLNEVLNGVNFVPPPALYLGLITVSGEVVASGYSRANVTGKWSSADENDTSYNIDRIDFVTPQVAWGTITGAALYDAAVGGNTLSAFPMSTPVNITPQSPVYFNSGTLKLGVSV